MGEVSGVVGQGKQSPGFVPLGERMVAVVPEQTVFEPGVVYLDQESEVELDLVLLHLVCCRRVVQYGEWVQHREVIRVVVTTVLVLRRNVLVRHRLVRRGPRRVDLG